MINYPNHNRKKSINLLRGIFFAWWARATRITNNSYSSSILWDGCSVSPIKFIQNLMYLVLLHFKIVHNFERNISNRVFISTFDGWIFHGLILI
jgi:hypothetical protein